MRLIVSFCFLLLLTLSSVAAQVPAAPCGVVDALDFPIPDLREGYDDFALYRERFGGNHTGIDIGFDRWGDPVRAAARGRVTYSDLAGWDTEKGVVIVEHTFPDGSIAYSLYGHVEQTDGIFLPPVGECVERGEVIAAIGWPSRGRPHLHYEIRDFLPDDGGPGYVTGNPLDNGWYNPLDFTALWRARLTAGFLGYATFDQVASLPPIQLDSGRVAIASGDSITGFQPPDQALWRVKADGVVTGLAALPGDRVAAHTRSGQAMTLQNGRYESLWRVDGPDAPLLTLGDRLIFVTTDAGLAAYDSAGTQLWALAGQPGGEVAFFQANGDEVALAVESAAGITWRTVSADGQVTAEVTLDTAPVAAALSDGGWLMLAGTALERITASERVTLATVSPPAERAASLTADTQGNAYVYLGDADSTLLAVGAGGDLLWRATYPTPAGFLPPLLASGSGCVLAALDADGRLHAFNTQDGALVNQLQLYAGGTRNGSPGARLLRMDSRDLVMAASGFLTMVALDGRQLGAAACT